MIKPLRTKVVVKPIVRTLSEVLIVKNTEPFNEGTIMAVGPLVDDCAVGDFIKYGTLNPSAKGMQPYVPVDRAEPQRRQFERGLPNPSQRICQALRCETPADRMPVYREDCSKAVAFGMSRP